MKEESVAMLGNKGEYSSFSCRGRTIRFRTSRHLERYTAIKTWDNGYLEVMAQYDNAPNEEEEYIDLIPILKNLYMEPQEFLRDIKEVGIRNE
ncbi:MAG: hypothetical protein IJU05_00930 [Schwartzia sp.]|nr:hypothetical protein [Schwartzia sp. (in: firmicutes)]